MKAFFAVICLVFAAVIVQQAAAQCCQGSPLGPCVNQQCPNSTMCTGGYCCPGCYDTCCNCYLYTGYCGNPYYAGSMACCQRTCGACH